MSKKPYSFATKIDTIKKFSLLAIGIFLFLSISLMYNLFDSKVVVWIDQHKPTIGDPFNPSSSLIVPYGNIVSSNVDSILLLPLTIFCVMFVITKLTSKILIKKEVLNLYDSVGVIHEGNNINGVVIITNNEEVQVIKNSDDLFELRKDNKRLTFVTGDELYWKKKYLEFINSKE